MRNIQNLKSILRLGKTSGGYFITSIINNALPFVLLPVLTSYLLPEDYANITLFTTYFSILNATSAAAVIAFITNIFFKEEKKTIQQAIGNSIVVVLSIEALFTILLVVLYYIDPNVLGLELNWLLLIPVSSFSYIVFQVGLSIMRNQAKVVTFSYHQIFNTLLNTIISIVLVAGFLIGWQGRVLGIMVSLLISALVVLYYLRKRDFLKFDISSKFYKKIAKFILTLLPNSIQSVLGTKLAILFIQFYFAKEVLGVYSVGFQVSYSVMILVITLDMSWSPYFYKKLSVKDRINKVNLVRLLYLHLLIVFGGIMFVNVFSGFILELMTTDVYFGAKEYIPWLTFGFLFNAIAIFVKPALIDAKLEKDLGLISFLLLIIMFVLNILLAKLYGPLGIVYAFFASYCLMFVLLVIILIMRKKQINLPWLKALYLMKK